MLEDFGDKTQEPTSKKLADARSKGFVAKSQDLTICILLLSSMVLLFFLIGHMSEKVASISVEIFSDLYLPYDNIESVVYWSRQGILTLLGLLTPLLGSIFLVGLLANMAQVGLVFNQIKPNWKNINFFLLANYERSFSIHSLVRLGFSSIRWVLMVVLNWTLVFYDLPLITEVSRASILAICIFIKNKALLIGGLISISYLLVAILDYLYQRWRFKREMRMTKREVKDEVKQIEGDIFVKNKIREAMLSLGRDDIRKMVPSADVIVTELGNYAVAISYRMDSMNGPLCLCKGFGKKADLIVNIAKRSDVPIVENSYLAQSLFRSVKMKDYIPPEFYQEVALALAKASKQRKESVVHV